MRNGVEIKVFGLSPEASARLGGVTDAVLDLSADFSLSLSKDVEKLSLTNKISTEGALGFEAEFTKTNNAIFSEFSSPATLDSDTVFYRVGVTAQGHGLQFDRLVVTGKTDKWQLELRRSPDHWVELASQYKTNDVDFGTFIIDPDYFLANWAQGAYEGDYENISLVDPGDPIPTYWPLIDYGGWCDESKPFQGAESIPVKAVGYEDFRPLISLPFLLKKGFCLFGWTLEGVIFDTDWVKRLWVYALRPDYYIASETGGRIKGRNFTQFDLNAGEFMYFDELVQGVAPYIVPYGPNWVCGVTNNQGISLKYTFKLKGNFTNSTGAGFLASFVVKELIFISFPVPGFEIGQIYSEEYFDVGFTSGETKYVEFEQTVIIGPGSTAFIGLVNQPTANFFAEPGLYFEIAPASKCFMSGETITVSDAVSDENTILDWTKAFCQLCDGRVETNIDTRTVTIHPNKRADVYGTVVPQFLKVEESAVDISNLIIKDSIHTNPVRPDLKRKTRLEFATSTDAYISSLNLSSPAHSRTITNGENLPDEIESIQNLVFEPTLEGQTTGLATDGVVAEHPTVKRNSPVLPRLWDNINGDRSFDIGPRILFGFGLVKQFNPTLNLTTNDYSCYFLDHRPEDVLTGLTEEFGYATQLRTKELDPAPTIDGNVVFGSAQNDLFVNFWLGLTQNERKGTAIDLLMRMQMKDYVGYDFRSLFFFYYNGVPLRVPMTSIRDFQTCSDMPTPVTFFAEPADTECCDLPCGCQFTTCEYYQDLGVYLRQATLDLLKIDSFIVDGIELLSAPVSLGYVNMVNIGGKPFCTNLVDALNSIAAPYFSFDISTRIHPTRGARFFKIKHLACVPFRILITLDGAECYLYTQAEQKQKYFSGTWSALGYAPDTYTEPIDCVTVTEY